MAKRYATEAEVVMRMLSARLRANAVGLCAQDYTHETVCRALSRYEAKLFPDLFDAWVKLKENTPTILTDRCTSWRMPRELASAKVNYERERVEFSLIRFTHIKVVHDHNSYATWRAVRPVGLFYGPQPSGAEEFTERLIGGLGEENAAMVLQMVELSALKHYFTTVYNVMLDIAQTFDGRRTQIPNGVLKTVLPWAAGMVRAENPELAQKVERSRAFKDVSLSTQFCAMSTQLQVAIARGSVYSLATDSIRSAANNNLPSF